MFSNLVLLYKILPASISYSLFIPLGWVGLYRWFQYIVKFIAYMLYKPIKPDFVKRKYTPAKDVTIVVPTIDHDTRLLMALKSWLAGDPYEVIFVTIPKVKPFLEEIGREADPTNTKVRVLTVPAGNKRKQMVVGASEVKTSILIFCDDDVIWPRTMIDWCLAPFENEKVGAVGTSQGVIPDGNFMTIWEILAAYRLTMRNVEIAATACIDGGVSCLSGRTACYRTSIVQDPAFTEAFLHEYWLGRYHQHSGDDKFLTRWVQGHHWRTWIQACPQVELITSFKANYMFLIQLLRWTRNTWRSDIRALFYERALWKASPYTAYSMFDRLFNPITLIYGFTYFFIRISSPISTHLPQVDMVLTFFLWYILIRFIKYLPHLVRRPQDLPALPIFVAFQYIFIFMKVYCLFTLHITTWGTRKGAETAEAPPGAEEVPKALETLNKQPEKATELTTGTTAVKEGTPTTRRNRRHIRSISKEKITTPRVAVV